MRSLSVTGSKSPDVGQWITSRKVVGSIPVGIHETLHWFNPFVLGWTQPLTQTSTKDFPWGKGGRGIGLTVLPLLRHDFQKSWSPQGLSTPIQEYLFWNRDDSSAVSNSYSRVLPKKLRDPQLIEKFPAFNGTRWFITAFTTAYHLFLSWARSIHSMPSRFLKKHFNIILPSTWAGLAWWV